jgi:hypothetical protein
MISPWTWKIYPRSKWISCCALPPSQHLHHLHHHIPIPQPLESLRLMVYWPICLGKLQQFSNKKYTTFGIIATINHQSWWPQPKKNNFTWNKTLVYCAFNRPIFPYLWVELQFFMVHGPTYPHSLLFAALQKAATNLRFTRPPIDRQGAGRWISCANLGAMGSSYDLPKRLAIGGFTMDQCSIWCFP